MDDMRQALAQGLEELGLSLSEDIQQTLCDFGCGMVKQNEVMNLTAITDEEEIVIKL